MKSVDDALRDLVQTCEDLKISYAVMGGLAVRVHGIPRPTHDVDMTLSIRAIQLPALLESLETLGYTIPEPYRNGWLDDVAGMRMMKFRAYLDAGFGIDVDLFLAESPFQRSLMARRISVALDQRSIDIVSPEDLILLKLIANRPRDLADIGDILFTQGELDQAYLRQWATQLGIEDRLQAALEQT